MTQAELDILAGQKRKAHEILMSIISDQKALAHTYWRGLDGTDGLVIEFRADSQQKFLYGKDNALYFETEDGALTIVKDSCIDVIELGKPNKK